MIQTTQDLYYAFLDGIKKSYTGTVVPSVFNRIINVWGQDEWVKQNAVEGIELNQKQIDDLSELRVVTDGAMVYETNILYPIAPITGNSNQFYLPEKVFDLTNVNGAVQTYPKYLRTLNVMFKLNYVENECDLEGVSDWLQVNIMRSDQRAPNLTSPYRKPKDDRVYYEKIQDRHRLITGTPSYGHSMRLEYIRYPRRIFFDIAHPGDAANPNYTPGTGSVNCEMQPHLIKEIVDLAIRIYLERVKEERYRTFLNEEMIRKEYE